MRSLLAWSQKTKALVLGIALIVLGFGIQKVFQHGMEALPELSATTVEIQTEALGLSANEVEQMITVPLEADLLNGVPWLKNIRSNSIDGLSSIQLIFDPGTDVMNARQMVQERLTQAHALPQVSKPPVMLPPLSSASRIMAIAMSSKQLSPIQLSVLAHWIVRPRLMGIPGVANVSVWGERNRELQVQIDPRRLSRIRSPCRMSSGTPARPCGNRRSASLKPRRPAPAAGSIRRTSGWASAMSCRLKPPTIWRKSPSRTPRAPCARLAMSRASSRITSR